LRLAVFGGNDDAPRFVVAPVSVQDCFYQIINAFNLAEKYQTPVLCLSDQDMSVRVQTIPPFDLSKVKHEPRLLWDSHGNGHGKYERYTDTPTGVSPMSLPGMSGGQYTAEGLEHYASGAPGYDPELHRANMEKRYRKLDAALADIEAWGMYEQFGDDDAALGIIGWGSTIGPVREAVARAKDNDIPVAVFYPKALFPLPDAKLKAFLERRQAVIVPEMNYTGQFAGMLRARAQSYGIERPIVKLNQYGGVPFSTRQMFEQIVAVNETLKK
jgi:2-oxoglutarate ferredoxin oxidoreductase subunit alpha